MTQEPIRARIRRLYAPNALYFITAVTRERQPVFTDPLAISVLRQTMRRVKEIHPFGMHAFVFLPDHLHLLIHVPDTSDISKILHSIQRNCTINYKRARGITREVKLWQRGFWDHVVRDVSDLANHFHYIHFNPVKHGYATRPEEYAHSSFGEYVNRGWYEIGWGHVEPEELRGLEFE